MRVIELDLHRQLGDSTETIRQLNNECQPTALEVGHGLPVAVDNEVPGLAFLPMKERENSAVPRLKGHFLFAWLPVPVN